jgi:hypothetical protein
VSEDYPGLFDDAGVMIRVFLGFILGMIALYAGYYMAPRAAISAIASLRFGYVSRVSERWPLGLLIVGVVGWFSVAAQMLLGTWSTFAGVGESWRPEFNQLFAYVFNYVWFCFIGAALWVFWKDAPRSTVGYVIAIGIIVLTMGIAAVIFGSKTWTVYPVFWLCWAAYAAGRQPSRVLVAVLLAGTILISFSFVTAYRAIYLDEYGTGAEIGLSAVNVAGRAIGEGVRDEQSLETSVGRFVNRLGGVDNAARVMTLFPDVYPYFYFRDLLLVPLSIVPRFAFPWKPTPEAPSFYSVEVAGMLYGGSASPHPLAEGYLNGGLVGVIALFWFWGVLQAVVYRGLYLPRRSSLAVTTLYGYIMLDVVGFGGWIVGLTSGLPAQVLVTLPALALLGGFHGLRRGAPSAESRRSHGRGGAVR